MKRSIWIFLVAILLPSIGLGWLALRSAGEQQIILERRTTELYQKQIEEVAGAARASIDDERRAFTEAVRQLVAAEGAPQIARDFTARLTAAWPRKAVGFAIGTDGRLLSPSPESARTSAELQTFLLNNAAFLAGTVPSAAYAVSADDLNRPEQMRRSKADTESRTAAVVATEKATAARKMPAAPAPAAAAQPQEAAPAASDMVAAPKAGGGQARNVVPQRVVEQNTPALSQLVPATADFQALTLGSAEGVVTRFVQDRLEILFWVRPAQSPEMIFGCRVTVDALADVWRSALMPNVNSDVIVALLDEKARPVAMQPSESTARDWKRPFVASEIGEALPHWEAALYLQRPEQMQESARAVRRTLMLLIVAALAAIAFGGWAVFADARRQLALAQKKTDFVSNVSHELKTPLTSIRMFAELMQSGNVAAEKRGQYLRIIMAESERLTRLINNVLDFARLERRQKRYDMRPLDLHATLARTWERQELHLRENGFTARWQAAPPPYRVNGDEDALAQVIVNLLSNAEKYSGERKEVELHSYLDNGSVFVSVLDRGSGVPAGEEAKIFEAFYRAHDSLSSGIQGSGLGLTLAQRIAKEHGGEITYQPRAGGGSNFTLRLPRVKDYNE